MHPTSCCLVVLLLFLGIELRSTDMLGRQWKQEATLMYFLLLRNDLLYLNGSPQNLSLGTMKKINLSSEVSLLKVKKTLPRFFILYFYRKIRYYLKRCIH